MMVNFRICGDFKAAIELDVSENQIAAYNEYNTIEELLDFESELKLLAEIIETNDYTLNKDYRFKQITDVVVMMLLCAYKENLIESKKEGKKKISQPLFEEKDIPDFFQDGLNNGYGFKPDILFNKFELEESRESFSTLLTGLRNTVAHGTCIYNFLTGLITLNSNGLKGEIPLQQLRLLMNIYFNDNIKRVMNDKFAIPVIIGDVPALGIYGTDDFHFTDKRKIRKYLDNLYVLDVHVKNANSEPANITYGEIYDLLTEMELHNSTYSSAEILVNNFKKSLEQLSEKYKGLGVEIEFSITKLSNDRERYKRIEKNINMVGNSFFEENFEQRKFIINLLTEDKNNIKLMNDFLKLLRYLYFNVANLTLEETDIDPNFISQEEYNELMEKIKNKPIYMTDDYVLCLFETFVFCYYGVCCRLFKEGFFGLDLDNFDIDNNYIYKYINKKIDKFNTIKTNELTILQNQILKGDNDKAHKSRKRVDEIENELKRYQELLTMPLEEMLSSEIINNFIYESIRNAVVHQNCKMSDDKQKIIIKDIDYSDDECTFAATVDKQVVLNMIKESQVAPFLGLLNEDYVRIKGELLAYFLPVVDAFFNSEDENVQQYIKEIQEKEPHKAIKI